MPPPIKKHSSKISSHGRYVTFSSTDGGGRSFRVTRDTLDDTLITIHAEQPTSVNYHELMRFLETEFTPEYSR